MQSTPVNPTLNEFEKSDQGQMSNVWSRLLRRSPCSSLSSRSWMSELSSCDSFSHGNDEDADLHNGALLLLPGSPGSGGGGGGQGRGGEFGVELWQQKYQNGQKPACFSPTLSPYQSPQHSPRASVSEDTWMSRRPSSRSPRFLLLFFF